MKRIIKYLCIAAVTAMMSFPTIASGQDAIFNLNLASTQKSIVREYLPNTGCSSLEEIIPQKMDVYERSFKINLYIAKHSISFINYYPSVEFQGIDIFCGGNKNDD